MGIQRCCQEQQFIPKSKGRVSFPPPPPPPSPNSAGLMPLVVTGIFLGKKCLGGKKMLKETVDRKITSLHV